MVFVGTLIICLYYRDAPIVVSMTTLDWCLPRIFVASTEMCCTVVLTLDPLCPCSMVLYQCMACGISYVLAVSCPWLICCIHFWRFLVYFSVISADGDGIWVVVDVVCYFLLYLLFWIHH